MNDITKGILGGTCTTLLVGALLAFFSKGTTIWNHVDVENQPVSKIQKTQNDLDDKFEKKNNNLLEVINNNIEISKQYGEQITIAVKELKQVKISMLTKPVRGKVTRVIGKDKSGKNSIWVNRYSDARDFKINETVRVTSPKTEILAVVAGYILDQRESVIFKANADVASQIELSESKGIMSGIEMQRVIQN
jgi:hypothetical protein